MQWRETKMKKIAILILCSFLFACASNKAVVKSERAEPSYKHAATGTFGALATIGSIIIDTVTLNPAGLARSIFFTAPLVKSDLEQVNNNIEIVEIENHNF